jgi:hypothetical protein
LRTGHPRAGGKAVSSPKEEKPAVDPAQLILTEGDGALHLLMSCLGKDPGALARTHGEDGATLLMLAASRGAMTTVMYLLQVRRGRNGLVVDQ